VAGACVAKPKPQCAADADCPAGHKCQQGLCVKPSCTPQPEVCNGIDDDCDGIVDDGAPCAAGQSCIAGACQLWPPECRADADCPAGKKCVAGACS
jgi:Cys-rich repeat protein